MLTLNKTIEVAMQYNYVKLPAVHQYIILLPEQDDKVAIDMSLSSSSSKEVCFHGPII